VFRDDVDGAFFRGFEVTEGVFGVGEAACETDYEEWWVMVYYLGVGEGSEVCGGAWRHPVLVYAFVHAGVRLGDCTYRPRNGLTRSQWVLE